MLEDLHFHHPSKVFSGVRFVLYGFDPIDKPQVLSKLVDGGGVDVGQYGPICTHVIVDKLIYDDPICVAARRDGKILVNGLWVSHCSDVGAPVDPASIMYRPLRDLNGVPGAKSLVVCLTGYQRQDREDIMTMVSLMGANFSKPLVANKVTHLICYKFEGEKYELAKKMKKINLVNHLWLEDCLKAWEILPESDYNKSGYELEVLEAEAKDSEEEKDVASEQNQLQNFKQDIKRRELDSGVSTSLSKFSYTSDMASGSGKDRQSNQDQNLPESHTKNTEVLYSHEAKEFVDVSCGKPIELCDRNAVPTGVGNNLVSTSASERCPHSEADKLSPKSYHRKAPSENTPSMYLGETTGRLSTSSPISSIKFNIANAIGISSKTEQLNGGGDLSCSKTPDETLLHHEEQSNTFDEKRKIDACGSSKAQKPDHSSKARTSEGSLEVRRSELLETAYVISDPFEMNFSFGNAQDSSLAATLNPPQSSPAKISKLMSSSVCRKSPKCGTPVSETLNSGIRQDGNVEETLQKSSMESKKAGMGSMHEKGDVINTEKHATGDALIVPSPRSKGSDIEKLNGPNLSLRADTHLKPSTKKMFGRKSGSKGNKTNLKGSIYLSKSVSEDNSAIPLNGGMETASHEKFEMILPAANLNTDLTAVTCDASLPKNQLQQNSSSIDDETEAPEAKEETEVREAVGKQMYVEVEPGNVGEDDEMEELQTREATTVRVLSDYMTSGEDNNGNKQKKITCCKRKLGESTHMQILVNKNASRGINHPLSEIKQTFPSEASEDGKTEVLEAVSIENSKEVEPEMTGNIGAEDKVEGVNIYKSDSNAFLLHSEGMSSKKKDGTKQKKATCGKRKVAESSHMENAVKNINAGKKRPLSKIKERMDPSVEKTTNLKEAANEEPESEMNEVSVIHPTGKTKKTESISKSNKLEEGEKENTPVDQNASHSKEQIETLASNKASKKIDTVVSKSNLDRVEVQGTPKPEPTWFILSGHRLQRKEFQQVIRRLKGKLCRDSHQWSYQATHFVVPDPIRRTEKFFAAAASGRWILKTDFLSDSSRAGKFLAEEPYEWHKSGLSEDGAINLEAPRKWRLQRGKTGHGAFYGLSIIIYGECIAPSLDTLKRVVKAGDGTILATSPPYTRFLKLGVDFAVVSPGMPRVDMWVQEFISHDIPCVLADYLVEFVCKPGYSLEKHVQFNTHALAEKAFQNLVNRSKMDDGLTILPHDSSDSDPPSQEVTTPVNASASDLPCQVCGSRDRGDEMLLCGDESGSIGCGIGTHIDCCDPPLADVPKEDWFCSKCKSKSSEKSQKGVK